MRYVLLAFCFTICLKAVAQNAPLTFTDPRDEKGYYIAKINKLYWFADNLNIPTLNSECYDNKAENCNKYGQLYSFEEAKTVCPTGWRLPNAEDWKELKSKFGSKADKIAQAKVWKSSKFDKADNESGLTVFPTGSKNGRFSGLWEKADFWLDSETHFWSVANGKNEMKKLTNSSKMKMAVRCVFEIE